MPEFKIKITLDNDLARMLARQQAAELKKISDAAREAGAAGDDMGRRGAAGMAGFALATGVAMAAAQKLLQVMQAVGQATKDANDKQKEYARTFMSEQDQLRELATLQGKEGGPGFTTAFAQFRMQTGMRTPEALAFQTGFFNAGSQFVGPGQHLTDAHAAEVQRRVAAMTVARGFDPKVMGDITGSIIGSKDWEKTYGAKAPEEVLATVSRVMQGIQRGKGDNAAMARAVSSLLSQFINPEDELQGTFRSAEELTATASAMAESKPEQAEVFVRALIRGKQFAVQKGIGGIVEATPQMEAQEQLGQWIKAEAGRQGRKVDDLVAEIFPDERERVAWRTMANRGVGPRGAIASRQAWMARPEFGAAGETANTEAYQADPGRGLPRMREAGTAAAITGRGAELRDITILREEALGRLIKGKQIDTTITNMQDYLTQQLSGGVLADQRAVRLDIEVAKILAGRTPRGMAPFDWHNQLPTLSTEARTDYLNMMMGHIVEAGGDPLGGKEAVRHLKTLVDQGANAPLPAPPVAGGQMRPP